jgi:SAM-dependent methyltransferase
VAADPRRAMIFGSYAEEYDRWRPSYPPDAVDWLLPPGALRVAEVGAGTGKLTGMLLERHVTVVAIEPDEDMLRVLRRRHPAAETYRAAADALPLPAASVDAVLVADAWHWFPHDQALDEVRRVLRPGGWLGLAWNNPSITADWTGEIAQLDPDLHGGDGAGLPVSRFGDQLVAARFDWEWRMSPAHLRGYLATHSGYAVMDPEEREARLEAAERILAEECRRLGSAALDWACTAYCFRWQPSAAS